MKAVGHCVEECHGQGGAVGQPVRAALTWACTRDGGSQRGFDGIDRHVGVFGAELLRFGPVTEFAEYIESPLGTLVVERALPAPRPRPH